MKMLVKIHRGLSKSLKLKMVDDYLVIDKKNYTLYWDKSRFILVIYLNGPQTNALFTPAVKLSNPSMTFSFLIRTSTI